MENNLWPLTSTCLFLTLISHCQHCQQHFITETIKYSKKIRDEKDLSPLSFPLSHKFLSVLTFIWSSCHAHETFNQYCLFQCSYLGQPSLLSSAELTENGQITQSGVWSPAMVHWLRPRTNWVWMWGLGDWRPGDGMEASLPCNMVIIVLITNRR